MDVSYLKGATGQLTATSEIDSAEFFRLNTYPGEVKVPVVCVDEAGDVVSKADIRLWISEKKKK